MKRTCTITILMFFLSIFQCSDSGMLLNAQENALQDTKTSGVLEKALKDAIWYYNKSITSQDSAKLANDYIQLSRNKIKVAELIIENQLLNNKKGELEEQLLSIQTDKLRIQDEIKQNISLVKDKKNQDKIAEELLQKNSFDKLEEALVRINLAEEADSTIYSSNYFNGAKRNYDSAKKHFDEGIYNESLLYSQKSIELADKAIEVASQKKQRIDDITNSLKNIFGFSAKVVDSSIILSSKDIFLPLSSKIRFDLYPSLDKIAETLGNYEHLDIYIESYDMSKDKNNEIILSTEQSKSVKTYLQSKGLTREIKINDDKTIPKELATRGVNIILKHQIGGTYPEGDTSS